MKNNTEKSLNRAISQLPHPSAQEIWEQPVNKMTEHDYITRQEMPGSRRSRSGTRAFFATAACFLMIFVGGGTLHYQNQLIRTVVDIDINPSVELNLNRKDKVVSATGLNHEAEELLNAVEIEGKDADTAIELIMLEAKEQYYFSQNENAVLISVYARNDKNTVLLEEKLSQQVRIAVDRKETPVTVVSQRFNKDDRELRDNSGKYKISQGKMALIEKLEALDLSYTREQLVSLPIEGLLLLLQEETELSDGVKVDSSTWISEKTASPVVEETRPEAKGTEESTVQETVESVAGEIQPETKPAPVRTKPSPAETKPIPIESPAPRTEAPEQQPPQISMPEADDLDDSDDNDTSDDNDSSDDNDISDDSVTSDDNDDSDDNNASDDNDDSGDNNDSDDGNEEDD